MKNIKKDSPEGQKLWAKYGGKIMQNGGIAPEEVLSGSVVTGVGPTQPSNVEVEGDEFVKTPDGNVAEVVGKPHSQGGEKLNLPEGSMVLSDNIKIGKEIKRKLEDQYDLDLKATYTFAQAHDKIKKKLGITDAEEQQEKYLKLLAKNSEIQDESTKAVNEEFLAKKLQETESALQQKKQDESVVYDMLFSEQEKRKESGQDVQVEETIMRNGGILMAQNGTTVPKTRQQIIDQANGTAPTTNPNIDLSNIFKLPAGKLISELTPEERKTLNTNLAAWVESFKETQGSNWINALSNISFVSGSSKIPISPATRKALDIDLNLSEEDANKKLADLRLNDIKNEFKNALIAGGIPASDIDKVKFGPDKVEAYEGDPWDPKKGKEHYKTWQKLGVELSNSAEPIPPRQGAENIPQDQQALAQDFQEPPQDILGRPFPIATPYRGLPNPLMTTQLNLPDADIVTPIKVSPEEVIRENQRGFVAARDVLSTMPGANVGANIANLLGQTSNVNNQAIAEANRQNAQYAMQTQFQNQQVGANLSQARTQAMDIFGKENLMALDNTLTDFRNLSEVISTDQINAQREGRQLNMMDALSPEYTFDQFGNVLFVNNNNKFFQPQNPLQQQIYNSGSGTQQPNQNDAWNAALSQAYLAGVNSNKGV